MLTQRGSSPSLRVVATAGIFSIVAAAITNLTGYEYVKTQSKMIVDSIFLNRQDPSDVDGTTYDYQHTVSGNETSKPFRYKSPNEKKSVHPFQAIMPLNNVCEAL